ncbi:GAF domain-containing protein [uncultured Endozoicomonas sp.]|uniref:GAF domain-containing protein n=1 Tax=uncultured Endozoicomonas sp. TaxID=432652 RepID=UPI00260A3495|nr:GAF domain-containing protein [uncultured Endozoicomonas sp.]
MHPKLDYLKHSWQPIVDQIASETGLHSILIMESLPGTMKVVCANQNQEVYKTGDEGPKSVQHGCHELYCERVVNTGKELFVPNAADSEEWHGNEDLAKFGLGVYLGLPVIIDGKVCGTVCALHNTPFDFLAGNQSARSWLLALQSKVHRDVESTRLGY